MDSCRLKDLGTFHVDSFNFVIHSGLRRICLDIDPVYTEDRVKISVSEAVLRRLQYPVDTRRNKRTVYPAEARLRGITYYAHLDVQLRFERGTEVEHHTREFFVPLMLKTDLCLLHGLGRDALVRAKEDYNDPGGYFIVNGSERLLRNFVVARRNYPLTVAKEKWKSKRCSEYGCLVRSVKDEHLFSTVSVHLLKDGSFEVRLSHDSVRHSVQLLLLLKALVDRSDASIVAEILKYREDFPLWKLKKMLRDLQAKGIGSHDEAKSFIGRRFLGRPGDGEAQKKAADLAFRKCLLVHLDQFEDKFQFLCFSVCRLHSASSSTRPSALDDLDNPVYQEVLSSGQVYMLMLREGIASYLQSVRNVVEKEEKRRTFRFDKGVVGRCCNRAACLSPRIASWIATGNFPGGRFGLRSETGYSVALKRTNVFELASQLTDVCRFPVPHFLKDTRAFYPESWGFLCPTQTPEGEKCGLHNYLASRCKVVALADDRIEEEVLRDLGVIPCGDPLAYSGGCRVLPVFLDGKVCGWIHVALVRKLIRRLRERKSSGGGGVPYHSEIVYVPEDQPSPFPGIYLFSSPCRMVRKVLNDSTGKEEYIGVFEQVFMQNTLSILPHVQSYSEVNKANILGLSARMIPYCEHNEAVRNTFASEKCKQALGLPFLNFGGRSDATTHQLSYCQSPLVANRFYSETDFDLYPNGTNVVVALMSYSGYDMEDALVLNRASVERGLMHNVLYKTIHYDLEELAEELRCTPTELRFRRNDQDPHLSDFLDEDGLPFVGIPVKYNDPILSVFTDSRGFVIKRYLERRGSFVHSVRKMGSSGIKIPKNSKRLSITFSVREVPVEGDKFANRHGGKGVCGAVLRQEDLPFTSSGLVPDVLFNPHGLARRMSMGVLFEMMAAKAKVSVSKRAEVKYTVEPFEAGPSRKVYTDIGEALAEAGLDYYGTEKLHSGTSGEELEAEIFLGCLYYLRLHHTVERKYQVQSVGPVDERTFQPVNPGRSGAVRFGEMERDALLSHGAAELTRDRLLMNSDRCTAFVCRGCHAILCPETPHPVPELRLEEANRQRRHLRSAECRLCRSETDFRVQVPYALFYLLSELAVVGIAARFSDE